MYGYQTGSGAEYLGWINLDRISAEKGEKGDPGTGTGSGGEPTDLSDYSTTDEQKPI